MKLKLRGVKGRREVVWKISVWAPSRKSKQVYTELFLPMISLPLGPGQSKEWWTWGKKRSAILMWRRRNGSSNNLTKNNNENTDMKEAIRPKHTLYVLKYILVTSKTQLLLPWLAKVKSFGNSRNQIKTPLVGNWAPESSTPCLPGWFPLAYFRALRAELRLISESKDDKPRAGLLLKAPWLLQDPSLPAFK
jgi:hypothetical protein